MTDFNFNFEESPHYDIAIEDPVLKTDYGFDKIIFPLNGNGTMMILHNSRYSTKTTHVQFDKHTYTVEKTIDILTDALLGRQDLELRLVDDIVRYVRKKLLELQENPDVDFFKNGKAAIATKKKTKAQLKSKLEQEQKEEKEHEERIAAIAKNISSVEHWQATLSQKYQNLYNVVQSNLPNLWHSLEFDLSIKNILHIKDCTLPFAGIVLGKPSSLKTVGIEMFRKSRHTFYTDKFSSKSFVSHSTGVSKEQLVEIDLLPKIKNKCFLTPELAPIFAARDEDLIEILGTLTRVLDGHGYESDSGAHGHRGYNERMMFVWIGAAVDIPFKVHKLLTTLGPKLYFLRVPKVEQKSDDNYYQQLQDNDFDKKLNEIQQALTDYQDYFEACPMIVNDDKFNSSVKKMPWISSSTDGDDNNEYQKKAYMHIIKLGKLLAHLRGVVPTWHTQDTQGSEYGYGLPIIEEPDRAMQQLVNLAKGHALLTGRNYVTIDDLPMIIKVVLSTAPMERVTIFDILLANNGILTTNQVTEFLNVSKPTALRTMTELKALGLVDMKEQLIQCEDGNRRNVMVISLKEQFDWFLSEEFKTLREGFKPEESEADGSAIDDGGNIASDARKEKYPPPTTANNAITNTDDGEEKNKTMVYGGKFLYAPLLKFLMTILQLII
jgi:predicted transcriptional regulator